MPKSNKAKRRPDHTKMSTEERIRNFRLIDDMFFGAVMNDDIELTEKNSGNCAWKKDTYCIGNCREHGNRSERKKYPE